MNRIMNAVVELKPFSELTNSQRIFIELMVLRCQSGFVACQEFLNYSSRLTGINFGHTMWCDGNMPGEFLYIHPEFLVDTMKDYTTPVQIEPSKVFPVRFIERMEANKIPITKDHITMMSRAKILQQVPGTEKYKYLKPARVKRDIKFTVPTVEMVFEFMKEKTGSTSYAQVSSQKFVNYYSLRDWKVQGRKPMENWKLSAAGWVERNYDQIPIVLDDPENNPEEWATVY